jgi:Family of unknown function (DUF6134)
MRGRRILEAIGLSSIVLMAGLGRAEEPASWNFLVTLDGQAIGRHRFTVADHGSETDVISEADYRVKVLGITAYHYRHRSAESSSSGCLQRIAAKTDDNGKLTFVDGQIDGPDFAWRVRNGANAPSLFHGACPMTFAYWDPVIARRDALLDPGSGRLVPVRIEAMAASQIDVHGEPTAVSGLRIIGLAHPIDVWYRGDYWVGLDTTVAGGRVLRYRIP